MWNDANPLSGEYDYSTAYVDFPAGETLPEGCDDYTMNTIYNGRRHSNTSNYPYNSNGATDATAGRYIVTISGNVAMVAFNDAVQWRTVNCCEQSCASGSDDWEYCALNSLAAAVNWGGNRYVRRLNDRPSNRVVFQGEAFDERIQPRSGHYWFCYTSSGRWTGKCYMHAVPNNGTGFGSDTSYWSLSPEMRYKVPFPVADGRSWYIWIRGMGCSYDNDSVHVGLNNQPVATASDVAGWQWHNCWWSWESIRMDMSRPYVNPSWSTAGCGSNTTPCGAFHTLNIWMREDGLRVDKIILTSDPNYVP